jgi:hypothetical protein
MVARREGLEEMTFAKCKDLLSRYAEAAGHDHPEWKNLLDTLQQVKSLVDPMTFSKKGRTF